MKYLIIAALTLLFAMPVSAEEKVKLKLPDGLYMYDLAGTESEGRPSFQKYFVTKNNTLYSAQEAIKKFGVANLNKWFAENKKYNILFGGEKIGETTNILIEDENEWRSDSFLTRAVKKEPVEKGKIPVVLGSLGASMGVPEAYQATPRKVYTSISKEEVATIESILKQKLFHLIKNRKELAHYKVKQETISSEELLLLDKVSRRNEEMYIGVYHYIFKVGKGSFRSDIVFSLKNEDVQVVTSKYDEHNGQILDGGMMSIYGMLDVDGCGEDELIIEKEYDHEYEAINILGLYKQKSGSNWIPVQEMMTRRAL